LILAISLTAEHGKPIGNGEHLVMYENLIKVVCLNLSLEAKTLTVGGCFIISDHIRCFGSQTGHENSCLQT
jgi:hypothetical protein